MTTTSTANTLRQIRSRLLSFVAAGSPTPNTLATDLTGGLWIVQAPDNVSYPYGVIRIIGDVTDGAYNSERQQVELEVQLYHRPRTQQETVEDWADICDEALLRYNDSASGLVFSRSRLRSSVALNRDPADREIVAVRMVYSLVVWPIWLTQYAAT